LIAGIDKLVITVAFTKESAAVPLREETATIPFGEVAATVTFGKEATAILLDESGGTVRFVFKESLATHERQSQH
jgi:hypothetical protein